MFNSLQPEKTYLYLVRFYVRSHARNGTMTHPRDMWTQPARKHVFGLPHGFKLLVAADIHHVIDRTAAAKPLPSGTEDSSRIEMNMRHVSVTPIELRVLEQRESGRGSDKSRTVVSPSFK